MFKKTTIFFVCFFFYCLQAKAEEKNCVIKMTQDILNCALEYHPEVVQSQAASDRDKVLKSIARQRPNPEVEGKVVTDRNAGVRAVRTETSLLQTIELGGKRRARIHQAEAQGQVAMSDFLASKEQVALNTVLSLYRLRQISSELHVIQASLTTFGRIAQQYRSRSLLTPEQEVSFSVFNMGSDDLKLKHTSILDEARDLQSFLEVATGLSFDSIKKFLPSAKNHWPPLNLSQDEVQMASSEIKKAQAEMALARANLKLAKSRTWPDFKLGPTVETETVNRNTWASVGGSFSIPLPLLSLNHGEKIFAKLDQRRASLNLEATQRKTVLERAKLVASYQSAVKTLARIRSVQTLNTQNQKMGSLFDKGLVPSMLVIEAHRQLYDITKTRNEQELTGIDALWRLYIIDGKVLDAKL